MQEIKNLDKWLKNRSNSPYNHEETGSLVLKTPTKENTGLRLELPPTNAPGGEETFHDTLAFPKPGRDGTRVNQRPKF